MRIVPTKQIDHNKLTDFFISQWGSPQMVISSGIYHCDELDGFAIVDEEGNIKGLVTYILKGNTCEIISLDSLEENKGIGSTLLKKVEQFAKKQGCQSIQLITTNDNLHALAFYQKRGYQMVKVYPNAVEKARQWKPEIPLYAENGIPIRDEILLEKVL